MNPVIVKNIKIGEGMPKICVPIVEQTEREIFQVARKIKKTPADLAEWRADWFESVFDTEKVKKTLVALRKNLGELPLLFTFRTKSEGGEKEIAFEQYGELLKQIANTGLVDLIDVEIFAEDEKKITHLIQELQLSHVKIVGSNHDFVKTPAKNEMLRRLCYMQKVGADIPKIAVMPQSAQDVQTLLETTKEMAKGNAAGPIITMSMSELGAVSRIEGEIYGSSVTFGTLGRMSAPGQIEVGKLKELLEHIHQKIK